MNDVSNRFRGCLLGLAVGDALGTTLEFRSPGSFAPISDMVGGGPFGLRPGEWTDDTSMALCLAESLIETGMFDPIDQLTRYVRWYRKGHLSSTGRCFDIGNTTSAALQKFEKAGGPYCGSTSPSAAGNGSLMRLCPVPMFFASRPDEAVERSGESSRTTHGAVNAVDSCRYFGGVLVGALNGDSKETILAPRYCPVPDYWSANPLAPEVDEVALGSFKHKQPPAIRGTGYVVHCLESALWAFYNSETFESGCLMAVNLGDDADTTGAVYGQIAGAFYGESGIPESWRSKIAMRERILDFGDRLFSFGRAEGYGL